MNALNWLDGSDGLCGGGVSFIALITIFFLAVKPDVNQPAFAIIAASGAGATFGFFLFKSGPCAYFCWNKRIDVSRLSSRFPLYGSRTKIATALLVLMLPVADSLLVITERFVSGTSIFERDRRHLHHKLSSLGWSRSRIIVFLLLFTTLVAYLALQAKAEGKLFILASFIAVILFFSSRDGKDTEIRFCFKTGIGGQIRSPLSVVDV